MVKWILPLLALFAVSAERKNFVVWKRINPLYRMNGSIQFDQHTEFFTADEVDYYDEDILGMELNLDRLELTSVEEETDHWNLDRVDGAPLDQLYHPTAEQGSGVDLYFMDTGLKSDHEAFSGRVVEGFSAFGDNNTEDCNGHGNHVASIAAGLVHGIARNATLIPVRMMSCTGMGDLMNFITGANWIIERHRTNGSKRAIVNLSIQTSSSTVIDKLIDVLTQNGIFVVASAGNRGDDACLYSPSGAENAFTVGSIGMDDQVSNFSNRGECVRMYAPGEFIIGAGLESNTTTVKTGTSMSAPLAVGVAATIWERYPMWKNFQIWSYMQTLAGDSTIVASLYQAKPICLVVFKPTFVELSETRVALVMGKRYTVRLGNVQVVVNGREARVKKNSVWKRYFNVSGETLVSPTAINIGVKVISTARVVKRMEIRAANSKVYYCLSYT